MATQTKGTGEKSSMMTLVFAAAGTLFLGLPLGFFMVDVVAPPTLDKSKMSERPATEGSDSINPAVEDPSIKAEISPAGPFELVQLPPIITNISEPQKVWVRLEGQLLFEKNGHETSAVLSAELAQHVMTYLKTLKLTDIQGAGAIHDLTQDMNEIVRSASDGQVQGLLLSGLVFE
jgi:hypothetical protein